MAFPIFLKAENWLAVLLLLLSACSAPNFHQNPDSTTKRPKTSVESYTQHLVDHYCPAFPELKKKLAMQGLIPLEQKIAWLQQQETLDCATVYLITALLEQEHNLALNLAYLANISSLIKNPPKRLAPQYRQYYYLFVPGWLYQTMPETGADFALIRKQLEDVGLETELLATRENASIAVNAAILQKRLLELKDKQVIVISVSKSGSEVASLIDDDFLRANPQWKAWVNISGLLGGTPLADIADEFPLSWLIKMSFSFYGLDTGVISELRHKQQKRYFTGYCTSSEKCNINSASFRVVNLVAVPFYDQLSASAWAGYQFLYEKGPNDGRALIIDQLAPGNTLIEIGLDHYYRDKNMSVKALAIVKTLVDLLQAAKHPGLLP